MLLLKKIFKTYQTAGGTSRQTVLSGVDFSLSMGGMAAIMGPSGCGKSTLLNLIGCLDDADRGEIVIDHTSVTEMSEREKARFRNERMGFVFQAHHLLGQCTVLENVLIPVLARGGGRVSREDRERAEGLLERVKLMAEKDKRPGELSGGQCQRAALARALINRPKLILADEPTGSLDQDHAIEMMKLLLDMNRDEGASLVVVTHSEPLAEMLGAVYHLNHGVLTRQDRTK